MFRRNIYIYSKNLNQDIIEMILSINETFKLINNYGDIFCVEESTIDESTFDFENIRELIISDFLVDISFFIEPYYDFSFGYELSKLLKRYSHGIYYFEDIIPYLVIDKHSDLQKKIKEYLINKCGKSTIKTVLGFIEANLNATLASKRLYLHRNTLNYRLDSFTNNTLIDVRTFKGANAIYLLFNY